MKAGMRSTFLIVLLAIVLAPGLALIEWIAPISLLSRLTQSNLVGYVITVEFLNSVSRQF